MYIFNLFNKIKYSFQDLSEDILIEKILPKIQTPHNLALTSRYYYYIVELNLKYYIKSIPIINYKFQITGYDNWIKNPIIKKLKLDIVEKQCNKNRLLNSLHPIQTNLNKYPKNINKK